MPPVNHFQSCVCCCFGRCWLMRATGFPRCWSHSHFARWASLDKKFVSLYLRGVCASLLIALYKSKWNYNNSEHCLCPLSTWCLSHSVLCMSCHWCPGCSRLQSASPHTCASASNRMLAATATGVIKNKHFLKVIYNTFKLLSTKRNTSCTGEWH